MAASSDPLQANPFGLEFGGCSCASCARDTSASMHVVPVSYSLMRQLQTAGRADSSRFFHDRLLKTVILWASIEGAANILSTDRARHGRRARA